MSDEEAAGHDRRRRRGRIARAAVFVLVSAAAAVVGVLVAGHTTARIGPFDTTMRAVPGGPGGTRVSVAPFGRIDLDSHRGPFTLDLRVDQLREEEARAIAGDPENLAFDEDALAGQVRDGVHALIRRVVAAAVVSGAVGALIFRRRWTSPLLGGLVGLVLAGSIAGVAASTWNSEALAEPRYHGLLRYAPDAVGDAQDVVQRINDYQAQVSRLIENVVLLYQGATEVRSFRPDASTTRVLHVSDLHLNPQAFELIEQVAPQFGIDLVIDTGDINDWGTTFEARYADRIGELDVPYVFIRGNHDSAATARAVARQENAMVLDGDRVTIAGLDIWGVGDPRFTPDKARPGSGDDEQEVAAEEAPKVARSLRSLDGDPPDIVLVHDPAVAADLGGLTPLILAGHRHESSEETLDASTRLLVEGSTGGAGLRGLQKRDGVPLSCSVLYFDTRSGKLEALDRIEIAGVNRAEVRIERKVFESDPDRDRRSTTTQPGSVPSSTTSTSRPDD
ncbi:metallophosphoesterase [Aquihabitans daechungensis]|uniref:metallophosphoesterase family protein n=1 Tax=Aquihabitans daechungensis TaxID=1052257 RepID=UPI003B9F2268